MFGLFFNACVQCFGSVSVSFRAAIDKIFFFGEIYFLDSRSGSVFPRNGSVSQRNGSVFQRNGSDDPDLYQNVTDANTAYLLSWTGLTLKHCSISLNIRVLINDYGLFYDRTPRKINGYLLESKLLTRSR